MKALALWLLRNYKRWISPAFPPSCRYVPTCSEYAMEAVERYGALRGGAMGAWRLLRCHPLATGGLDLVVKKGTGYGGGDGASPAFTGMIRSAAGRCVTNQDLTNPEMTS
jgi:putative membrane protein insertion efficiency factor